MDAPDGNGERILHPGVSSPTRWTSTVLYSSTHARHPPTRYETTTRQRDSCYQEHIASIQHVRSQVPCDKFHCPMDIRAHERK